MNETQLKVFVKTAECGSFTKTAERLFMSPPAVMNQVNSLESELGVKLFIRSPRGVILTEAGRTAYDDSVSLLRSYESLVRHARQTASGNPFLIRVGTSLITPCGKLMETWNRVKELYPQFKLQVIPFEYTSETSVSAMEHLGNDFDVLVSPCASIRWLSICGFYALGEYPAAVAFPSGHRLAERPVIDVSDLDGETLMMVKRGDTGIVDTIRDDLEKRHHKIHIVDAPYFYDYRVFNRCVEEGWALLTLNSWSDVHPMLRTVPVNWDYRIPYGLLYSKKPSEDVLRFLDVLRKISH